MSMQALTTMLKFLNANHVNEMELIKTKIKYIDYDHDIKMNKVKQNLNSEKEIISSAKNKSSNLEEDLKNFEKYKKAR